MGTQKISPAPGGGKTRSAKGGSDPRIGIPPAVKGTPLPDGKTNGKVFANNSPGEACSPGYGVGYAGPKLKGAPMKTPSEDKSSRNEH